MPADASIVARIGGDASGLVGALDQAQGAVKNFSAKLGTSLEHTFSGNRFFHGILQGIGIGSVHEIAQKMIEPFKEAAESAKKIEEYTNLAAESVERMVKARQTEAQQLAVLEKQYSHIQKELDSATNAPTWLERAAVAAGLLVTLGPAAAAAALKASGNAGGMTEDERAKAALALQLKGEEIQKAKDARKKKDDAEFWAAHKKMQADAEAADKEEQKNFEDDYTNAEKLGAAHKANTDFDREQARGKMSDEEKLADLQKEKAIVDQQIAKANKFTADMGQLTIEGEHDLLEQKKKQVALEKEIGALIAQQAKTEVSISETIAIRNVGRGDTQLSDRELENKVANLKQDIFTRQLATQNGSYDGLLGTQQINLQQTLAEQAFRDKVRNNTASFGSDRAFQMAGVSEQRFAQINSNQTAPDQQTKLLQDILARLRAGIPTIPVNAVPGGP